MRVGMLVLAVAAAGCAESSSSRQDAGHDAAASLYAVRGVVGGLAGSLTIAHAGEQLVLTAAGPFAFTMRVVDGDPYAVTIVEQPSGQTCTITGGQGTVAGADVAISISCIDNPYLIGGTVSGLTGGSLVLNNNGVDLAVLMTNGPFAFAQRVLHRGSYAVTIATLPVDQRCVLTGGSGVVEDADVDSVVINCIDVHDVGGTITGFVGGTLVVHLDGVGDRTLTFPATSFNFPDAIDVNGDYEVTITTQPAGQHCTVSASSTNVGTADVTDVAINCAVLAVKLDEIHARPASGASGNANADAVRDGNDDEFIELVNLESMSVDISGWQIATGAGTPTTRFTFPSGSVLAPGQRAVVFGGGTPTGSFGGALVRTTTNLALTDAPAQSAVQLVVPSNALVVDSFTYDGTAFGSSCTTSCQSRVRDPGTGNFVGHTQLSGSAGILWSPGVAPGAAIPKLDAYASSPPIASTSVAISANVTVRMNMWLDAADIDAAHFKLFASSCASPANEVTLSSISAGADASQVVLAHTAYLAWARPHCVRVDASTRSANGTPLAATASYEFMTIDPGPTYAIGGAITGLVGSVVLQNSGADDLLRSTNGGFTFATPWPDGATYDVTVTTQPPGQRCTVANGSSTVMGAAVSNIAVSCKTVHAVGGTVTGLAAGSVTIVNNGGDPQQVTFGGTQSFTFTQTVAEGDPYDVTISAQPTGQHCTVAGGQSTMGTSDVSVTVNCAAVSVVIDEIHPAPAASAYGDANHDGVRSDDDEFIELLNREAFPVAIGGWTLAYGGFTRFTFPGGTTLGAGQRAVVFRGGTPIGGFGDALTFAGLSATITNTGTTITVSSAASGGIVVDTATFAIASCTSSTTTCSSVTRDPPGTGSFVAHTVASGSAGVLWSPGTLPTAAVPKLSTGFSTPGGATASIGTTITARFNMFMSALTTSNLKLYQSSCSAPANELATTLTAGSDASFATLTPASPLGYQTTYCVQADAALQSAIGVSLGSAQSYEFTTRAAQSAPATSVVISEVGGCHLTSTGTNTCGDAVNDEFIELYNPTASDIDISGWFVSRRSAGGTPSSPCYATIPASTTIAAHGYYLIGGAGYLAAHYAGAPAADLATTSTALTGGAESVLLISSAGSCSGTTNVVDAVSAGAVTETGSHLQLPAYASGVGTSGSIERKACFNSTGDTNVTTGLWVGGGHASDGNSERIGAGNADWTSRTTPSPQSSASPVETRSCL